ncbi:hypothetical protein [Lautropia mirabilis]
MTKTQGTPGSDQAQDKGKLKMAMPSIHGHLPALQKSTRERPSEGGNRFPTIAPYYILAHSLFNQVQKKSCSQSKEPVKVVRYFSVFKGEPTTHLS